MKIIGKVPRVDGRELSYRRFWEQFMQANKPVLLTGLMDSWAACRDWVLLDGKPNLSFIAEHFGSSLVQVADCARQEFTDQKRSEMTVKEFVEYWQAHHQLSNKAHKEEDFDSSSSKMTQHLLYLKDWHFVKEYPDYVAYETPVFFEDDWLNLYLDETCTKTQQEDGNGQSDYRFVYMGPKGTWTPLHADVLRSYSWSANICGYKLWHLLPPEKTSLLYDRHKKNTVYDIYGDISLVQFPGFSETGWVECEQGANEILFVPSGWYHQVTNLEDTISINHNWLNACNLRWNWNLLLADYSETVESIEDIRDIAENFEELCQRNLAANSGMNFEDFFKFLANIAGHNLNALAHNACNNGVFPALSSPSSLPEVQTANEIQDEIQNDKWSMVWPTTIGNRKRNGVHDKSQAKNRSKSKTWDDDQQHVFNLCRIEEILAEMSSEEYFVQLARSQEVYNPLPQLPQESLGTDESEHVPNSLQGLKSLQYSLDEALKKYTRKTQASTTEVL
ncbi:unnamed protein product [Sphagnum jensenii]|uniref:JmjC domain-containing protein n=1 Tax=Sphagnum jensenii TaxID=128206 RepID=A0ABP0X887_9BRYO